MEKVYVVVGTVWEHGSLELFAHTVVSEYAVHSTLERAQEELKKVADEIVQDADEMGYEVELDMKETKLTVIYPETETEELWLIHERIVDKI